MVQQQKKLGSDTGTATTDQVLSGATFSNSTSSGLTGTMTNNGAITKTLNTSTTSYTIPAGYHNGSGKVSITTQTKTVTPSTSVQTIKPDSGKVLSAVTVNAVSGFGGRIYSAEINHLDTNGGGDSAPWNNPSWTENYSCSCSGTASKAGTCYFTMGCLQGSAQSKSIGGSDRGWSGSFSVSAGQTVSASLTIQASMHDIGYNGHGYWACGYIAFSLP